MRNSVRLPLMLTSMIAGVACDGDEDNGDPPAACTSYEPLTESIAVDTTLDGCYRIDGVIFVDSDATLTIRPGSVLMFADDAGLEIVDTGAIAATGTADAPITFTAENETRGAWRGIALHNTQEDNLLQHVVVEYGGGYDYSYGEPANIALTSSGFDVRAGIEHATVRHSAGWGLFGAGTAILTTFAHNTITGNATGAATLGAQATGGLEATTSFTGNDTDVLEVREGSVITDQTWPAIDVPYEITGAVFVSETPEITLTIEAGAELRFHADANFEIGGESSLRAVGTASAPVLLTWAQSGAPWKGLHFHNTASASNLLEHVIVEHGGGYDYSYGEPANVAVTSSGFPVQLSMRHTTLKDSAGFGMYVSGNATLSAFADNAITTNTSGPLWIGGDAVGQLDDTSSFTGNTVDTVIVGGASLSASQTWAAIDVPYELDGVIHVDATSAITLTIAPGATLSFRESTNLEIGSGGCLHAAGTAAAPILFTRAASSSLWKGLHFHNSNTNNLLEHVIIEYGGNYDYPYGAPANVAATSSGFLGQLTVQNSSIQHSGGYGLWVDNNVSLTESDNTFNGNASGNVYLEP